jgi:hypothetical protein
MSLFVSVHWPLCWRPSPSPNVSAYVAPVADQSPARGSDVPGILQCLALKKIELPALFFQMSLKGTCRLGVLLLHSLCRT